MEPKKVWAILADGELMETVQTCFDDARKVAISYKKVNEIEAVMILAVDEVYVVEWPKEPAPELHGVKLSEIEEYL